MKSVQQKISTAFLVFIFLSAQIVAQQPPTQNNVEQKSAAAHKTSIALLGVYHFDNPNQDMFNVKSDSILSEKRQREIDALAKQLAKFKPTHIALEFNKNDSALDKRYQEYLNGAYKLSANERDQIGFRLAKMLGHKHIYSVDEPSIQVNFNPDEQLAAAFSPLLQQLTETGNKVIGQINKWVQEKSVGAVLSELNTDELDKMNIDLYYRFLLPIGKGDVQPGVEGVTNWYKRNLYILKNIKEVIDADKSEKKVLVIFGQGHTAMLKQFMQYSSEFEVTDIQQYLSKE
jgi:NAD-dependent DNA ligase